MMADYPDQTRNLNPTPEATVARIIWGKEYAAQRGGTMDFWDTLSPDRQRRCWAVVTELCQNEGQGGVWRSEDG